MWCTGSQNIYTISQEQEAIVEAQIFLGTVKHNKTPKITIQIPEPQLAASSLPPCRAQKDPQKTFTVGRGRVSMRESLCGSHRNRGFKNQVVSVGLHNLSKSFFLANLPTISVLSMGIQFIPQWKKENTKDKFKHFKNFRKKLNNVMYCKEISQEFLSWIKSTN